MTPEQWSSIIQAVGFPICTAIAMGWALWKIGSQLLASHFTLVDQTQKGIIQSATDMKEANRTLDVIANEMSLSRLQQEQQTKLLAEMHGTLPSICMADHERSCEHFKPRQK